MMEGEDGIDEKREEMLMARLGQQCSTTVYRMYTGCRVQIVCPIIPNNANTKTLINTNISFV